MKSTSAIIVAAGSGTRMKSSVPKPFLTLDNNTILYHTIQRFLRVADISEIIIVTSSQLLTSEYLWVSIPKSASIPITFVFLFIHNNNNNLKVFSLLLVIVELSK